MQHPLLDDDGDGKGSWMDVVGQEDGGVAAHISLGLGLNPAYVAFTEVQPTQVVMSGASSVGAFAKTNYPSNTAAAWVEIRSPSFVMPDQPGTGQVVMDYPKILGIYSGTSERWEFDISSYLTEAGRYTLFYNAMDSDGGVIPPGTSTLYVNTESNDPPLAFDLISPNSDVEVNDAWMVFQWGKAIDSDPVTYTLKIYDEAGDEIKRYELIAEELLAMNAADEEKNDGSLLFATGSSYHWGVEAIDDKGGATPSERSSFRVIFPTVFDGLIVGRITPAFAGALIRIDAGEPVTSLPNGHFTMSHIPGKGFTVFVDAAGFAPYEGKVSVSEVDVTRVYVTLTALGNIIGRVLDTGGNPVNDATVETDWAGASTFCLENGHFILTVPPGTHCIAIAATGYVRLILPAIVTQSGGETNLGNLTLKNLDMGDLDCDGNVSLKDAILALKMVSGLDTDGDVSVVPADVNSDSVLGLAEAIYVMQAVAGLRSIQ